MNGTYFGWLARETPSRAWINNPTRQEIDLALAQGAVSCTTNPAFGGSLLTRSPEEIVPDIEDIEGFGPVQHFRDDFIAGWVAVRDALDAVPVARDHRGSAAAPTP